MIFIMKIENKNYTNIKYMYKLYKLILFIIHTNIQKSTLCPNKKYSNIYRLSKLNVFIIQTNTQIYTGHPGCTGGSPFQRSLYDQYKHLRR